MKMLENITTNNLKDKTLFLGLTNPEFKEYYNSLEKYEITNYAEIEKLINENNVEFNNAYFKESLKQTFKNLNRFNKLGHISDIYKCEKYKEGLLNEKDIYKTDINTYGNDLIITSIISTHPSLTKERLSLHSIYRIRSLLNKLEVNTNPKRSVNALESVIIQFGPKEVVNVKNAIDFYDEQIIRQSKEVLTKLSDTNIFNYDYEKKRQLVIYELENIVNYLVRNADVCIWGNFSYNDKKKLLNSIKDKYEESYKYNSLRNNFIDLITHYTTLCELKDGIVKKKTLNRFIIK